MSRGRILLVLMMVAAAWPAAAQTQNPAPPAAVQVPDDPDLDARPAQPDFTIVNLPTTLRLPRYKSAFRVTHRFTRPLGQGDFSDLAEDFFGLDSAAQIGLEYRFGLMRGLQIGVNRTSDRTIQFFQRYNVLNEANGKFIGLDVTASIDGTDNFSDSFSPSLGAVVSHEFGKIAAVYFEPIWVNNANPAPKELEDDQDTFMFGIGGRLRVRPTLYVVGEFIPRTGYTPGVNHGTFGLEKRAGGHVFQVNFSNGFGTTMGQLARGGTNNDDWYLGFNISRKFF